MFYKKLSNLLTFFTVCLECSLFILYIKTIKEITMKEKEISQEQELDIVSGSHRELAELFPTVHEAQKPLIITGHPGIGKTDFMRSQSRILAEKAGLEFSDSIEDINNENKYLFLEVIAHQLDQGDLKGLYFPNKDRTKAISLPIGTFPDKGQGMIFLDEMNLALPGVMSNLYQVFTRGYIGSYKMPNGFSVYAAGNLETDRAYTHEVPRPLNNRMLHFLFTVPKLVDWMQDFAEKIGMDYRILSYLGSRPDMLYYLPPDADDDIKAFPTPRSWSYCDSLLKALPANRQNDSALIAQLVGMAVGKARGIEFSSFLEIKNKWNIADIYKTGTVVMPSELDELYALSSGLIGYYKEKMNDKDTNKYAVILSNLACQFPAEETALIVSTAKATDKNFFEKLRSTDKEAHLKMVRACGKMVI
jgi:hypothetical protein